MERNVGSSIDVGTYARRKLILIPVKAVTQLIKIPNIGRQLQEDSAKTWTYMYSSLQGVFLHTGNTNFIFKIVTQIPLICRYTYRGLYNSMDLYSPFSIHSDYL